MQRSTTQSLRLASLAVFGLLCMPVGGAKAAPLPAPAVDQIKVATPTKESIVLAGGCFWGMESVFEHVKGVTNVDVGYAGGDKETAHYEIVSNGTTGHAESAKITYDPSQVSLGRLLQVYFSVAHDPTQLNRQGPDSGTQYRSAIFYSTPEQQKVADAYIAQLNDSKALSKPIATKVMPLKGFYEAESYHQGYAERHPDNPYILVNDRPKVSNLQKQFPDLYVEAKK